MKAQDNKDVLEQNVSTLLEGGGEPPRISDAARSRIRDELVTKHGAQAVASNVNRVRVRVPLLAVGFGLAATAATALVILKVTGDEPARVEGSTAKLADGSTYIAEEGAKVTVLGPRRVRVEGAALLDVAPGKGTFIVETARGRIEVLGTRFLVAADTARTTAAVVRGQVKLATEQGAVTLHAGEQGVAEQGKPPVRGPAPRLSHLVSWAQQARRREEGTGVKPLRNGSLFARDPGVRPDGSFGEEYPLPIKQLALDVVVEDRVARVALDQTFSNPHDRVLEGVYKFAIPPDAALQRLAMYVDGTLTESAVVERMRARRIYEELVYRRIDPALLEYAGTGRLNLRVYPIPARQDKRLMIAYTQSVAKLYSDWTLTVPLPEVDQPVGELAVTARIKGCANCELTSPGNAVKVERTGNDAIVTLKTMGTTLGDSFVVHVRDTRKDATVATKTEGLDRYLMVRAPADLAGAAREYRPRTWVILDDVSASRSPQELAAQADVVDALLRELDEDDKVSIVAFDVEARTKLPPTRVDDVDRRAVRQALKDEGGVGATDFGAALDAATKLLAGVNPDDAMVVYLGDGVITSGARNLDALRAQLAGKAHFVGVGIGDGPDTQTLYALAGATGGFATTIDLSDDVRWRAFDLVAALHTTRVTGVAARLVDASGQLVPATLYVRSAQLADGEELELVGKLASDVTPAAVELTGTRDGKPWQQRIALAQPDNTDAGYLPRLWAQQHIGARMLAKHDPVVVPPCTSKPDAPCPTEAKLREARDEEIRKEIVMLGKQYFLLSRHTSLIVLENDAMYAKYGVRKGGGDTWAPYAMPAKIAVVTASAPAIPRDVADDAELVRTPIQIFYNQQYGEDGGAVSGAFDDEIGRGRFGAIGAGNGTGMGFGRGGGGAVAVTATEPDADSTGSITRSSLGLADERNAGPMRESLAGERWEEKAKSAEVYRPSKRAAVSTRELENQQQPIGTFDLRRDRGMRRASERRQHMAYGVAQLSPARYTYPGETTYDDISALIPALVPDAADGWRMQLVAGAGNGDKAFPIDDAAKQLLAVARTRLASGIYRWGDLELAVDGQRRLGWRRTTDVGLHETASFDGAAWTRRYAELGISATRPVREDAVALSLAYLPIWIAEPAHYARWFVVRSRGPREISLSIKDRGKDRLAYILTFDDASRLVSITDETGAALLSVTWSANGPTAARVLGGDVSVGYTAETIADAAQWAHGTAQPGITVELPSRVPAYWKAAIDKQQAGSAGWRHAQRQLLVSAAALQDRSTMLQVYEDLRANGGVELGDLVLAAPGVQRASDKQFADALAPLATHPVARYLIAGRAYAKTNKAARLAPETRDGVLGAVWTLRSVTAHLQAGATKAAVDELLALGDHAYALRLAAAAMIGQRWYDAKNAALVDRAWQSVAVGAYKNVVLAQSAQSFYRHGQYDLAAERMAKAVAELDLDALPAYLGDARSAFRYSRHGEAGWHVSYARWRDRVLAGNSFDHLMAFATVAAGELYDMPQVLARASELAGDNVERRIVVARTASQWGHDAFARQLLEQLLATSPTPEVYRLAWAQTRGHDKLKALEYLEKAQEAGADEEVDLDTVRRELREIILAAREIVMKEPGAARQHAVERVLLWAKRWRAIDPGNSEIDRHVGDVLLMIGDGRGAWRHLSSQIERDPWSGAGYIAVAQTLEHQGKVAEALDVWQQAIVIEQTNPTPRLRKAQALIALGRTAEGDALLQQIVDGKWHEMWSSTVYQAKNLLERGKTPTTP